MSFLPFIYTQTKATRITKEVKTRGQESRLFPPRGHGLDQGPQNQGSEIEAPSPNRFLVPTLLKLEARTEEPGGSGWWMRRSRMAWPLFFRNDK